MRLLNLVPGVLAASLLATSALADTITLGAKDFESGILTFHADYQAAQQDELDDPDFDPTFKGVDIVPGPGGTFTGEVYDGSFTIRLGDSNGATPQGESGNGNGTISGATLTLGLFDHDSAADGSQLDSFTMNGTALTEVLNAVMEAGGGTQTEAGSEYNVYTIELPTFSLTDLRVGLNFRLVLSPDSLVVAKGYPATGPGNGAGIDFVTLVYAVGSVPEPSALWMLGLAALAVLRRARA